MYAEHQYDFTYQSDDCLVVMVNNPEKYSMVPSFPGGPKTKCVGLNDFRLNYFLMSGMNSYVDGSLKMYENGNLKLYMYTHLKIHEKRYF